MEAKITPNLLARAREHSGSDEDLVAFLRGAGLSKSLSIIAFAAIREVPPSVAKLTIHRSRAWAERRETDEALHTFAFRSLHRPT